MDRPDDYRVRGVGWNNFIMFVNTMHIDTSKAIIGAANKHCNRDGLALHKYRKKKVFEEPRVEEEE